MYRKLVALGLPTKLVLLLLSLAVLIPGGLVTEASFSQVQYPGATSGGLPLTFDLAAKINNFTAVADGGRLQQLATTQYLDLGIILGCLLVFPALTVLLVHALRENAFLLKIGRLAFVLFLLAPLMDLLENTFLLLLLGDFQNESWNFLNSLFTLGKITFFVAGWLLLLVLLSANILRGLGLFRGPRGAA